MPDWDAIAGGEGIFGRDPRTLTTQSIPEITEEEQPSTANDTGKAKVRSSIRAAVEAAMAAKQQTKQALSAISSTPGSSATQRRNRLTDVQRRQEDNMRSLDNEAAVWQDMPAEMTGHPAYWPIQRTFASVAGTESTSNKDHVPEADDTFFSYPPPYGIRPQDENYHPELAKYESKLMSRAKDEWFSNHSVDDGKSLGSPEVGESSPPSPAFKHDLDSRDALAEPEGADDGLVTWSSLARSSPPRRPPPSPPLPPAQPRSRSVRFADEVVDALETRRRSSNDRDQQEPGSSDASTSSSLGVHVVEEADSGLSRHGVIPELGRLQSPNGPAVIAGPPSQTTEKTSPLTVGPSSDQNELPSTLNFEWPTTSPSRTDAGVEDPLPSRRNEHHDEVDGTGVFGLDEAVEENTELDLEDKEDEQERKDSGYPESPSTHREREL